MATAANDKLIEQAQAQFDRARYGQVTALCTQVLRVKKTHPRAHALLGQVAYEQQRYDEATAHFQRAVAGERRNPSYHALLATVHLVRGRFPQALAGYEKALKLQPSYSDALAGKAETLERMGKRDRAIALLEPAVRSGKATARMTLAYVRSVQAAGRHEDVVTAVEEIISRVSRAGGAEVAGSFRRSLLLASGASLDRLGETDRAFAAFEAGNQIGAVDFDPTRVEARFDRLKQVFAPDALRTLPRATHGSQMPVFVVGMPRSGTTLIDQIIHAHPAGAGVGETHDMAAVTRELAGAIGSDNAFPQCVRDLTPETVEPAAALYLDRIRSRAPQAERISDKSLENYENLGLATLLVPGARVIHARRHPMDVCFSCYMHDLWPRAHPHTSRLDDLGRFFRAYDALMRWWQETLDIEILDFHYEAIVADPEAETRRLIDFIGLPWDDACLQFHDVKRDVATISYDQVRQPIYTTARGRYQRYETHLAPLRAALGDLAE